MRVLGLRQPAVPPRLSATSVMQVYGLPQWRRLLPPNVICAQLEAFHFQPQLQTLHNVKPVMLVSGQMQDPVSVLIVILGLGRATLGHLLRFNVLHVAQVLGHQLKVVRRHLLVSVATLEPGLLSRLLQ